MTKKIEKSNKRRLQGTVVSNKMTGVVSVSVSRKMPHPKYGKIVSFRKKFYAKTEDHLNPGDIVVIEESKPISKTVRWIVIERK